MQMKDISRRLQKKEEETAIAHVAKTKVTAAFCTKCVNLHNIVHVAKTKATAMHVLYQVR